MVAWLCSANKFLEGMHPSWPKNSNNANLSPSLPQPTTNSPPCIPGRSSLMQPPPWTDRARELRDGAVTIKGNEEGTEEARRALVSLDTAKHLWLTNCETKVQLWKVGQASICSMLIAMTGLNYWNTFNLHVQLLLCSSNLTLTRTIFLEPPETNMILVARRRCIFESWTMGNLMDS